MNHGNSARYVFNKYVSTFVENKREGVGRVIHLFNYTGLVLSHVNLELLLTSKLNRLCGFQSLSPLVSASSLKAPLQRHPVSAQRLPVKPAAVLSLLSGPTAEQQRVLQAAAESA